MSDLEISFDLSRLDFRATSEALKASYWGGQRTDEINRRAFGNSVCAIALIDGKHVGFARASGDRAVFARISDVIVWPGIAAGASASRWSRRCSTIPNSGR